jgi:hypothetical protein
VAEVIAGNLVELTVSWLMALVWRIEDREARPAKS